MAALQLGLILGAIGTATQVYGGIVQAEGQKKSLEAQKQAEGIKQRQMQLDAQRRRREIIRQGILQRAQATSQATAQGAQHGTALPGALGSITAQQAYGVQGVNQAEGLGNALFQTNRDALTAQQQIAQGGMIGSIGGGISSLGGAFTKNVGPINRLFATDQRYPQYG